MKRVLSIAITAVVLFVSLFSSNAADFVHKDSELLKKYSPFEIVNMFPDFSKYLADELRNYNTDINLRGYNISVDDIGAIFFSVVFENPDIFYVYSNSFESSSDSESGILVSLRPTYIFNKEDLPAKKAELEKNAAAILSGVDESWSDVYKCRYIHDMICQYVHYDMDIYNTDPNLRTAYGALVENEAVCEGYTSAYNYLLGKIGIEAHYIQSIKMEHAWSLIKLGGKYYHVDVTYDDPSYDTLGQALHLYCIISDTGLKADGIHHDWISSMKAGDKGYDSVWWRKVNTFIFTVDGNDYYMNQSYGSSVYGAFMKRNIQSGNERVIEKITTRWTVEGKSDTFWERAYCYITYDGNYFYYNDNEGVYRHRPDDSSYFDVLYKKPSNASGLVFGLALNMDSKLYVSVKSSPNVEDVVYYIDKNVMNQNFDAGDTDPKTEFNETEDGVFLTNFADDSENIIIPEVYGDKSVVAVGDNVFSDRQNLKSVIIPEGITTIGNAAFYNCPNLTSVTLPSTLKTIDAAAFYGCSSLKEITIPETVTKIGKNAFGNCVNLTIKGYKDSIAEVYANTYKIHFEEIKKPVPVPSAEITTPKKTKPVFTQKQTMYVKYKASISGSGKIIKCTSSKKSVASVSKKGVITAKKKGKATIKIEDSKYIYKIKLTVKNPKLNRTKLSLPLGRTYKLKVKGKAGRTTFKSSNKRAVSVSTTGKLTAKGRGKATITVKTNGKIKLKCKVTVK